ncbi:hypothetical protein BGW80DRAFT_1305369 [Lactifluus volemus]|nr:hypothetical protein BGW80DRAFT_1305369 [Lactifluus volemus]
MHFTTLLSIFLLALGHTSLLTFATPLGPGVARSPVLLDRCWGEPCRLAELSTISSTSAYATPTPAELNGDTTSGNISEPSPIPTAGSSSSNANAGVVLAPRNILRCSLLSIGIVSVLML